MSGRKVWCICLAIWMLVFAILTLAGPIKYSDLIMAALAFAVFIAILLDR